MLQSVFVDDVNYIDWTILRKQQCAVALRTRVGAIVVLTAFVNESTTEVKRSVPLPIIEDEGASSVSGLTVAMVVCARKKCFTKMTT